MQNAAARRSAALREVHGRLRFERRNKRRSKLGKPIKMHGQNARPKCTALLSIMSGRAPRRRAPAGWRSKTERLQAISCLERDEIELNRHPAPAFCLSMIFSESRFPLFGIML
jgi:hypothetical protein